MNRLKILFPYSFFAVIILGVVWSNIRTGPSQEQEFSATGKRIVDPVCQMDVNVNWNINTDYDGTTFHFCSQRCENLFTKNPEDYIGLRCLVCRKPLTTETSLPATYLERTYYLCSEQHRQEFKADPAGFFMHRMWGIPDWLYYVSIGLVLVISFCLIEGIKFFQKKRPNASSSRSIYPNQNDRYDLMKIGLIKRALLSRPFRFFAQLFVVIIFLLIICAGLFGHQNPSLNIAPLLTWTIWWCGLVVLIMFAGKAWCYVCPWDAIAGWMEKMRFWKKNETGMSLNLPWPRRFRNITLATFFFVGLTWVELGFGVTTKPRATAYLGIAMLLMTIISAFLFWRKCFCRYGCLIGRVSGLYALFAGIEFRSSNKHICNLCRTRECSNGSDTAYPCPTFESPATIAVNTYCIQCAECIQTCPHDNMAVNLRPWGADLEIEFEPRRDEAYLAQLMLSISAFHGLTMTPIWQTVLDKTQMILPLGNITTFSIAMFTLLIAPILVFAALVWLSYFITRKKSSTDTSGKHSYMDYFIHYSYCLLPIALFYHLAHNLEHLLMEGPKIITRLSDPFGWGWNLFNTSQLNIPPIVSLDVLWVLQVLLVGVGHVYSLWAAHKISQRFFDNELARKRGQFPMLLGMIAFSVLSLWLLKQPMEMRVSAM